MRKSQILTLGLAASALSVLAISAAQADPSDVGFRGWGPRVGVTVDEDQVHFGAHLDFGNFSDHVRFQPNVELGVSDNLTLLTLNGEAAYRFSSRWDAWTPYLGGGIGLNIAGHDGVAEDSNSELGVNALGGIERGLGNGNRFFVETKLGVVNGPDLKITTGWTFYH